MSLVSAAKRTYGRIKKRTRKAARARLGAWLGEEPPRSLPKPPSIPLLDDHLIRTALVDRLMEHAETLPEVERYYLAERLTYAVYPKYRFSDFSRIYLEDEAFTRYYERFMPPGNWRTFDRKYFLKELLKLIKEVPGDLVECGTYQGASAYLMCELAMAQHRQVHLFDSFEGLSKPEPVDGSWWEEGRFASPADLVRQNLAAFDCWTIHQGWIPSRFGDVADRTFAFVHVDVDLYAPTLESIRFFFERMSIGGVMLLDDYGTHTCPGAKKAADEYFADRTEDVLTVPTGQGLVIKSRA